jgi:hypothetical protein
LLLLFPPQSICAVSTEYGGREFELALVTTVADIVKGPGALLMAVAEGELTPSEAGELTKLLDGHRSTLATVSLRPA